MKTAVILAAGNGRKIWPYAQIRPKVLIPIANKPIIAYIVDILIELDFENIIIAADGFSQQLVNYFYSNDRVTVVNAGSNDGNVFTLLAVKNHVKEDSLLVFYGDTIIQKEDIESLINNFNINECPCTVLVSPLDDRDSKDFICCRVDDQNITDIMGHPRGGYDYCFCGYALNKHFLDRMSSNSGLFTKVQVGNMPHMEGYLEMSLSDCINEGNKIKAVTAKDFFIDIDKPWHIITAKNYMVNKLCSQLKDNIISEGAKISRDADIQGYVKLGRGSYVGNRVVIKGNAVIGDNAVIDNGAIINGNIIVGSNSVISNYCNIGENSCVGNNCRIDHCAEFEGVMFDGVYMTHYMEISGVIGMNTDIGAATVSGTLRFDDRKTRHNVSGRSEIPMYHSNSTYIGDFCRTGVNAVIMPGCKTGVYSIVGSNVLLNEDLPDNTYIYVQQELQRKKWGPEKYGW